MEGSIMEVVGFYLTKLNVSHWIELTSDPVTRIAPHYAKCIGNEAGINSSAAKGDTKCACDVSHSPREHRLGLVSFDSINMMSLSYLKQRETSVH